MHGFAAGYTDPELAALANYIVWKCGGRQGEVTAEQIRTTRNVDGGDTAGHSDLRGDRGAG